MDAKMERKRMKELQKMSKKELIRKRKDFVDQQDELNDRLKVVQDQHDQLVMSLVTAIKGKDQTNAGLIKSQIEVMDKELEYMNKREKALTEEIELISRAIKNDDEGMSSRWSMVGSWVIGGLGLGLTGWGLYKSHKTFEDGSMVDKGTKSLAEKINPFELFKRFGKK